MIAAILSALALTRALAAADSDAPKPRPKSETKAEACPHPSPHYERVRGKCTPSCGVLLSGRAGEMYAKKCPEGFKYAGFTWEEAKHRSKCCVADKQPEKPETTKPPEKPEDPTTGACELPPLHHINVHIRQGNGNRVIADATPIVCSGDPGTKFERYCQDVMKDPNRRCCPARPEGDPMRVPCELELLGIDTDGIPGPRWSFKGDGSVEKRADNPFLAYAYGTGTVSACSNKVNVCGEGAVKIP